MRGTREWIKHIASGGVANANPFSPALRRRASLAGRSRHEAQGLERPLGWGTQIRLRTPTCPASWFCPLSQLGRI